jgi:hypothetical protein
VVVPRGCYRCVSFSNSGVEKNCGHSGNAIYSLLLAKGSTAQLFHFNLIPRGESYAGCSGRSRHVGADAEPISLLSLWCPRQCPAPIHPSRLMQSPQRLELLSYVRAGLSQPFFPATRSPICMENLCKVRYGDKITTRHPDRAPWCEVRPRDKYPRRSQVFKPCFRTAVDGL